MPERYADDKQADDQSNIEERLSAYYGPAMPEQPLPASSWLHLSSQLASRRSSRRWLPPKWKINRLRPSRTLPLYIQEALSHVAFEANMHHAIARVQCHFSSRVVVPSVHISMLGKHAIRLDIPTQRERSLSQAELDVLLASGLARYKFIRLPAYIRRQFLLSTPFFLLLLATIVVMRYWHNATTGVLLFLLVCSCLLGIATLRLLSVHARKMVRRADELVVQWIGREHMCQGLHALAARNRASFHRTWGDLSLDERINNICHTHVVLEAERFTLVR